ncbi:serine aminopeptidase domain-containing protein [Leptothoe sp. PORK10 BA2]|uniref:serine aminopeptidase domain-containing protein n=1 Tax=Leptothoe sp. PORK10 BA2 TaxID=3110254 RepID=UPI002B1F556F|nr:alpha/beta hydrolase [Leptothoe sp. PORK10 BA2]MEA5463373.1 alpha/beta hydrolase [Leptothoe sp. PORK10 BA2]
MVDIAASPYILFVQHGWHDTNRRIHRLGHALADEQAEVIAPNLGLIKTWWRMEPLIAEVERVAIATQQRHPDRPWRIVGHSMGGLIWLELLQRHPEWWDHITSVSLVSSPVGGADLGRMIDPFRWGIGIARDLGTDRRSIAEQLARYLPIQTIASDYDGGSDGTVPIQCSQFRHARYIQLRGIRHDNTKDHPEVTAAIRQFWSSLVEKRPENLPETQPDSWRENQPDSGCDRLAPEVDYLEDTIIGKLQAVDYLEDTIIGKLQAIVGMTDAHRRDFHRATLWANLDYGLTLRTWRHPLGIHHVFLADAQHRCRYAGFVGWPDTQGLYANLEEICRHHGSAATAQA